jgi:alpha-tubulin suppressor-like RCC1 family protein
MHVLALTKAGEVKEYDFNFHLMIKDLLDMQQVWSWGNEEYIGRSAQGASWKPTKVDIPAKIVDVVCGETISAALDTKGRGIVFTLK